MNRRSFIGEASASAAALLLTGCGGSSGPIEEMRALYTAMYESLSVHIERFKNEADAKKHYTSIVNNIVDELKERYAKQGIKIGASRQANTSLRAEHTAYKGWVDNGQWSQELVIVIVLQANIVQTYIGSGLDAGTQGVADQISLGPHNRLLDYEPGDIVVVGRFTLYISNRTID